MHELDVSMVRLEEIRNVGTLWQIGITSLKIVNIGVQ